MKNYENTKMAAFNNGVIESEKEEERDIIVNIGKVIYRFKKGDPEWEDWKSVPSYDDADMVYALMMGAYVVEYRRLIPDSIKGVIKEECAPSSNWSRQFNEACKIYNHMCLTLDSCASDEVGNRDEAIFEKFYDLLYEVVTTFYKVTFYNQQLQTFSSELKQCEEKYKEFMSILHNYQKALEKAKSDASPSCDIEVWKSADRLIDIFNKLIKIFYERSLKYGAHFGEYDLQCHKQRS